jgi:hypothetical protein
MADETPEQIRERIAESIRRVDVLRRRRPEQTKGDGEKSQQDETNTERE